MRSYDKGKGSDLPFGGILISLATDCKHTGIYMVFYL